ncbi:MAG: response regulator [Gammaproteobacteria bacterium]|nr:response regulator [Gammaproteobacteria bacterium]
MNPQLLVVDDEPDIRELLKEILEDEGYDVHTAQNAEEARQARRARRADLTLLDIWMPDTDGITLLKEWSETHTVDASPVIMMSGHGTVETAVEATRLGAYDFIEKPLSMAKLLLTVRNALAAAQLDRENRCLRQEMRSVARLIGKSPPMEALRHQARRVAAHGAPILITGEAGSGKTTLARFIHSEGSRREGPFSRVSVAALANDDGDNALFGAEDGEQIMYGALEEANGGTLFLEDIADLPPSLQARLFGALDQRIFQRVGGVEPVALDTHVIVATSRSLADEVRAGHFRADLFYLVQVLPLKVPPLREHLEDLPELLEYCVETLTTQDNLPYRRFTVAAQNRLRNHPWSGNIRELRNVVQRLLILGDGTQISASDVDRALGAQPLPGHSAAQSMANIELSLELPLKEAREKFERAYFEYHLRESGGSVGKVANLCGVERTHLYRKLRALGINVKQITG